MSRRTVITLALLLVLPLPIFAATVRVTTGQAPLRSSPSTSAPVLARLDEGAILDLVDVGRDWYKVRDPRTRTEGFILASLVELLPGDATATEPGAPRATGEPGSTPNRPTARAGVKAPPPIKPGEWRDGGFVAVGGSFQNAGQSFEYSFNPPQYSYAEKAVLNTHYPLPAGPAFDAGGGVRVWRNLALGATVSVTSRSSTVDVDGTVPHPLYLNRDRAVSGSFSSSRTETAVHAQATWVVPGRRVFVSLAGGPTYFHVQQAIASGINLSTVYPYDTTEVTGAETANVARGGIGFNAGGDVVYFVTRMVGVGGLARFSRGSVTFPTPSGRVSTRTGGVQVGVSVRVRLMPAGPKTPPKGPARAPAPPPPPPVKTVK